MRFKILLTIIVGLLFMGGSVYADDAKDFPITGEVELGVLSVQGGEKSAKFNEYRDMKQGVLTNMRFGGDNGFYYMDFTGENVGRDDQFFEMKGGKYGFFDYSVYYNEIIHNLSFGAKTFYTNPGSNSIDYALDYAYANKDRSAITTTWLPSIPTDARQWNTFDYSIKRQDSGASINFSFGTPFYISVDGNQLETTGIQPRGTASNLAKEAKIASTSSGNIELPVPVDYLTSNLNIRTGYNTKKYSFALGGSLSRFENANQFLTFRNPFVVSQIQTEDLSQSPDNNYYKLMAQGSVRQLPLNSALAFNLGWSKLQNKIDLLTKSTSSTAGTTTTPPTYSIRTLGLNVPQFEGDIMYQTASVALTSMPVKALSTKIYFNYLNKGNDSTIIEYSNGTKTVDSELYEYNKNDYGIDVGLSAGKTKLSVGYEFLKLERERARPDAVFSRDDSFYFELKNNSLEWLTAKMKLKRLNRKGDFQDGNNNDSNYLWYFRRFDVASKIEDSVKLALDFDPTERFNLGLEYIYKKNDYTQSVLLTGRQSDQRDEYYVDMAYQTPNILTLTAFFDYEKVRNTALYRSNSTDPALGSTSSTVYNYTGDLTDATYSYGVGLRAPIIKNKLDFVASWTYEKANGNVDFQSPNDWGAGGSANKWWDVPISDDYTKQAVNLKAIYHVAKNLDMTFGYAYEDYTYEDLSTQGYQYLMPNTTSPTMFFTGAYTDSNYRVNTAYLVVGYKF